MVAAHGVKVTTHVFDLSKLENVKRLADAAGDCDILINNAGAIPRGSLDDVTPEAWRHGWDLKVFGYIDLTRYILPRMKARKSGVIINIIGMAGERPEPDYIATSCGNAALMMFTQCLGGECMRDGVRIVGVNPGPIMSDRHKGRRSASPNGSSAARIGGRKCTSVSRLDGPDGSMRSRTWWRSWRPILPHTSAGRSSA